MQGHPCVIHEPASPLNVSEIQAKGRAELFAGQSPTAVAEWYRSRKAGRTRVDQSRQSNSFHKHRSGALSARPGLLSPHAGRPARACKKLQKTKPFGRMA